MTRGLDWAHDGLDWPHRSASRFVEVHHLRWHVQHWPGPRDDAPLAVLIHGTGASTHTWRDVAPRLQGQMSVLAMDLPGHAFTRQARRQRAAPLSLHGMAHALRELLAHLGLHPALLVGHSAGAAIALRMCLSGMVHPRRVVGINAALLPLDGMPGQWFSPVARLMALTSAMPRLFAGVARLPGVLEKLLQGTGSELDARGQALYQRLASNPGHVAGALGMMARWDLTGLDRELARLQTPLDLIVGLQDKSVPPTQADRVLALLPPELPVCCTRLEGLGHLAHEERPGRVAGLLLHE